MSRAGASPFVALVTASALIAAIVVQTTLECADKVAIPLPGHGVGGHADILVCPVVLALLLGGVVLAVAALVLLWRHPHRTLTQHIILRALAQLPPARTALAMTLVAGGTVTLMLFVEREEPPALATCALMFAVLAACSLSAALLAVVAGRIAVAFGRRMLLAIVSALADADAIPHPLGRAVVAALPVRHPVPLLAAGRGLRAPPPFLR